LTKVYILPQTYHIECACDCKVRVAETVRN